MRSTIIAVLVFSVAINAKLNTEEMADRAKSLVEVKSRAATQYARAQSCSKKGMLILEGMKMEAVKRENLLQAAEEKGGPELKHAKKMDALMKMAMKGFQEKQEKFQTGLGRIQEQLEKEQTQKEAEILDKDAEQEYEDFKNKFELHGSSLLEQGMPEMPQYEKDFIQDVTDDAESLALLEKGVKSQSEAIKASLAQQAANEDQKTAAASVEAKVSKAMGVSAEIEALADEAIMQYLLNPTAKNAPTSLMESPSDFMNHRIVKMKKLEAPETETQQVVLEKVLKGMEKNGQLAIATVDLDSFKHDSQVQMQLICLKKMTEEAKDEKLFIDVHGGTRQRRDRVKNMVKAIRPEAKSLDKLKNFQAEDFTYKLADSLYKIGDFKKASISAEKQQQLNSDKATKVLVNAKAPKDQVCGSSSNARKQQKEAEALYKPYFGQTKALKEAGEALKKQVAENANLAPPSLRRASYMM